MAMTPTITALDYYIGQLDPLETLARSPEEADAINTLTALGMQTYSRSELRVADMAAAAMAKTLARSGLAPADVQAVVFATESQWDYDPPTVQRRDNSRKFRQDIYKAIWEVGLTRAYPFGVMFSGCGNLVSAIAIASNMIRAQGLENVLVVVSDRQAEGTTRVMFPAVGVVSDAAASCVVTSRPVAGFAIDDVVLHSNLGLWEADIEGDFGRFLVEMARGLKDLGHKMVAASGRRPADYKYFLPNNYSRSTLRVFCHQLGYQQSQLFLDNVPRVSHTYAADVLINLFELDARGLVATGDRVMALTSGPATWGMIGLTKQPLSTSKDRQG
jgi:3-oxoacyl-[acyl-carrier-protein] synthase-3